VFHRSLRLRSHALLDRTGISVAAEDKAILKFPGATTKITSLEKPHAPVRPNARLSAAFDSKLPAVREKATKPKTTTVPLHPSKVQTKQGVMHDYSVTILG
jgi:hypothetical protein